MKGIKDSSGDFANTKAYVDHFARDGFEVYAATTAPCTRCCKHGGAGCITAAANVGSTVSAQVYRDWDSQTGAEAAGDAGGDPQGGARRWPLIPGLKALVARNTRRSRRGTMSARRT